MEETICQGIASTEYFALAASYSNDRYVDLKYNQTVFSINQSDLLVKADVARKQIEAERKRDDEKNPGGSDYPWSTPGENTGDPGHGGSGNGTSAGGASGQGQGEDTPENRHFYMSVKLDNVRVNRDVSTYVQEIVRHLTDIDGADVEMKLEVEVIAPKGIPSSTVRTVSENCRTLKITDFEFDD